MQLQGHSSILKSRYGEKVVCRRLVGFREALVLRRHIVAAWRNLTAGVVLALWTGLKFTVVLVAACVGFDPPRLRNISSAFGLIVVQ